MNLIKNIPINRFEISQEDLNIENKVRSNLLKWNGQFSPQFVETLLQKYSRQDFVILDPFLGSGTVLYEAGCLGLKAYGTEINPAAYYLSQTYEFINRVESERKIVLNKLENEIIRISLEGISQSEFEKNILDYYSRVKNSEIKRITESFITLLDFYKKDLNKEKILLKWQKLRNHLLSLPFSKKEIKVFNNDARKIPLKHSSVDLVITSPPYINVFNYHQQYRLSVEALNWNCLSVAKSEFGSNRKNRGNRFFTVIQYCLDIAETFQELSRVCKKDARIIFIVGRESTVRGVKFYNGEIVANLGSAVLGEDLILRQERSFKNRFGEMIFEDIIHFKNHKAVPCSDKIIRKLIKNILTDAKKRASGSSTEGINEALELVDVIQPSSYFNTNNKETK